MRHILVMLVAALMLALMGGAAYASTADDSTGTPAATTDGSTAPDTSTPAVAADPAGDPATSTTTSNGDTTTVTDQSNVALQIATIVQSGSVVYICIITDSPGATCGDAIQVNQANLIQYLFQCNTTAADSCIIVNVVGPASSASSGGSTQPRGPNHEFLCSYDSQVDPQSYTVDEAPALIAQGYWLPAAVWGRVWKGTNIGDFHLVCNIAGDVTITSDLVNTDGDPVDQAVVGPTLGWYPVVTP